MHGLRTRSTIQALVTVVGILGATLLPATGSGVLAAHRVADAGSPTPVTYHLALLLTAGPMAGNAVDGQVTGLLDNTGTLTATLTATTDATASVSGVLSMASVTLTVQGQAGTFVLAGQATGSGNYGGTVSGASPGVIGSWLLTPEATPLSFIFRGSINGGRHRGRILTGTLTIAQAHNGHVDGALVLDDGTAIAADGRVSESNMQMTLAVPGLGLIFGIAPQGVLTSFGVSYVTYRGTFAGPGRGDHGTWTAVQTAG